MLHPVELQNSLNLRVNYQQHSIWKFFAILLLVLLTTLLAACGNASTTTSSAAVSTPTTVTACLTVTTGTIQSINNNTLMVSNFQGKDVQVTLTSKTTFIRQATLKSTDLKTGMLVSVIVTQNPDSIYSARAVSVRNSLSRQGGFPSGSQFVNSIVLTADNSGDVNSVQSAAQGLLEQRHNISNPANDDFTIQNASQVLSTVQATAQSLTILLVGVAAVSLIVGGIGIMNIMLVSVTERTREIGIRIAIGARQRDVLTQFLIEAFVLSALGGIVGLIIGLIVAFAIANKNGYPLVIDPLSILIAFGVSALVGIVFGFYPAYRAAHMDPIEALRME